MKKILFIFLIIILLTGCNEKKVEEPIVEEPTPIVPEKSEMEFLCEDLEVEIMNYENKDITLNEFKDSLVVFEGECNTADTLCIDLKTINDNETFSINDLRKLEKDCREIYGSSNR